MEISISKSPDSQNCVKIVSVYCLCVAYVVVVVGVVVVAWNNGSWIEFVKILTKFILFYARTDVRRVILNNFVNYSPFWPKSQFSISCSRPYLFLKNWAEGAIWGLNNIIFGIRCAHYQLTMSLIVQTSVQERQGLKAGQRSKESE